MDSLEFERLQSPLASALVPGPALMLRRHHAKSIRMTTRLRTIKIVTLVLIIVIVQALAPLIFACGQTIDDNRPTSLGPCQTIYAEKSIQVKCPRDTIAFNGGQSCFHPDLRSFASISFPDSISSWKGYCENDATDSNAFNIAPTYIWVQCCQLNSNPLVFDADLLNQFSQCRHVTNNKAHLSYNSTFADRLPKSTGSTSSICDDEEDLVSVGLDCSERRDETYDGDINVRWDEKRVIRRSIIEPDPSGRPTQFTRQCIHYNQNDPSSIYDPLFTYAICCKRNLAWFEGNPSRNPVPPRAPGQVKSLPRWQAASTDRASTRSQCSVDKPTTNGYPEPADWIRAGVCQMDPPFHAPNDIALGWSLSSDTSNSSTSPVRSRLVCGEGDLMVGIGMDCIQPSWANSNINAQGYFLRSGQYHSLVMSLNSDLGANNNWQLRGVCIQNPSLQGGDVGEALQWWTPTVSAFCYPQTCTDAPNDYNLKLQLLNGTIVGFTALKSNLDRSNTNHNLTCASGSSFDGLGDITRVERFCKSDFHYSYELPRCVSNVNKSIVVDGTQIGTISSTFVEKLVVSNAEFVLTCSIGYYAKDGFTRLPLNAANVSQQFQSICQPIPIVLDTGFQAIPIDSFTYRAQWSLVDPVKIPIVRNVTWHYELQFHSIWPPPSDITPDLTMLRDGAVIQVDGDAATVSEWNILVDSSRLIAQVESSFSVRLANSNGEGGQWQRWSGRVQLPCTCKSFNPATNSLSLPLLEQLSSEQLLISSQNIIELRLENWSPCIGSIRLEPVNNASLKMIEIPIVPLLTANDCPSANNSKLQRVVVNMGLSHISHVNYTVIPQVRKISSKSNLYYRYAELTPQRIDLNISFFVRISGEVRTAIVLDDSPVPYGISGANVTAKFRWNGQTSTPSSTITNEVGHYDMILKLDRLINSAELKQLQLEVSVADMDEHGIMHDYRYAGPKKVASDTNSTLKVYIDTDLSGRMSYHYRNTHFADASHIVLSGKIISQPQDERWRNFRECGVEQVRVAVYRREDATPNPLTRLYEVNNSSRPIRRSLPTSTTGEWILAVPRNIPIVVIPESLPNTLPHVFNGPVGTLAYAYGGTAAGNTTAAGTNSATTKLDFFDITSRTVKLRIYGGRHCKLPIGTAIPTFVHEGCGGKKVTMDEGFTDDPLVGIYTGAPPVRLVVKGWDPIYRGQFRPPTDQGLTPAEITAFRQDVHDWMDEQPTVRVDLRNQTQDDHVFVYESPQQVRLKVLGKVPCMSERSYANDGDFLGVVAEPRPDYDPEYFITPIGSAVNMEIELYEPYPGADCPQVDGNIFVHDFTFEAARDETQQAPVDQCYNGCKRTAVREIDSNGNWSRSKIDYIAIPNRVEWRVDPGWDVVEPKPANGVVPFSFPFYYRPGESLLTPKRTYIIVTGDSDLFEGKEMTLQFPSLPLFILHDPPGSMSTTSLNVGDSIELGQVTLYSSKLGVETDDWAGASVQLRSSVVTPISKSDVARVVSKLGGYGTVSAPNGDDKQNTLSNGYTYSQEVTTSDDRSLINGDASLALIHTGMIKLKEYKKLDLMKDGEKDVVCMVKAPYSVLIWHEEAQSLSSFNWVSKRQIREVKMRQIEREIDELEQSNATEIGSVGSINQLQHLKKALQIWTQAYNEFDNSINRALSDNDGKAFDPRTDKVQLVSTSEDGTQSKTVENMSRKRSDLPSQDVIDDSDSVTTFAVDALVSNTLNTQDDSNVFDPLKGKQFQSKPSHWYDDRGENMEKFIVSIDGGGSSHTFNMEIAHQVEGTKNHYKELETHSGFRSENELNTGWKVLVGFFLNIGIGVSYSDNEQRGEIGKNGHSQKLSFTLGDSDAGDEFDIEVRIDKRYNTPVFITRGGQTRCPYEAGTLPRESIRARLGYGQLTYIPPDNMARVKLLLDNRSPTRESWSYTISMDPSTDSEGLHMTIAGQPLIVNSVGFTTQADKVSSLTLEMRRVDGMPYRYDDISLVILPHGDCPQDEYSFALVKLSVSFQQECNAIEWSGLLTKTHRLIANSDPDTWSDAADLSLGKEAGTPIAIRNPEYRQLDRQWAYSAMSHFNEPPMLTRILLQYRRLGGDDTEWMDMLRSDDQLPNPIRDTDPASGLYTFNWQTNQQISDGLYEIRSGTHCFMPQGSIDSTLEYNFAPIKSVLIDHALPGKFGEPTPGLELYQPGEKLKLFFTEPIQCVTQWSELKVRAWSHPPTDSNCTSGNTNCCPVEFPACSRNPSGADNDPQPELTTHPNWAEFGNRLGGQSLNMNTTCRDNMIELVFDSKQAWSTLQGRLVTIMVWDVRDLAFNPMGKPISWTFRIKAFDVESSLMHVKGAQLGLNREYANEEEFRQLISREIKQLIDIAQSMQQSQNVSTSGSRRLFQQVSGNTVSTVGIEQIVIRSIKRIVTAASSSLSSNGRYVYEFGFDLLPGLDSTSLNPSSASALFASALDAGLHHDDSQFPLMAQLKEPDTTATLPSSQSVPSSSSIVQVNRPLPSWALTFEVDVTMRPEDIEFNAKQQLAQLIGSQPSLESLAQPNLINRTMIVNTPLSTGRNINLVVGSISNMKPDGTATVDFTWDIQDKSASSPPLSSTELLQLGSRHVLVRWRLVPDIDLDDLDEIGEIDEFDRNSWSLTFHTATPTSPVIHEVKDMKHRLHIVRLPTYVGGREVEFEVSTAPPKDLPQSTSVQLFRQRVFIVGPPSPPQLLQSRQLSETNVSFTVRLGEWNGLSKPTRWNRFIQGQLRYELEVTFQSFKNETVLASLTPSSSPTNGLITLPLQHFYFTAEVDSEGYTSIVVDLSHLRTLVLPLPGHAMNYTFTLSSSNMYSHSSRSSLSVILHSVPTQVDKLKTRQIGLEQYEITANLAKSQLPILYYQAGYTFLLGVEAHVDPMSMDTFNVTNTGPVTDAFTIRVRYPVPHTHYLSFHIFTQACNMIGCSLARYHRIYPVFISPPILTDIVQLQVEPIRLNEEERKQSLLLRWRPMVEVVPKALHTGYLLEWYELDEMMAMSNGGKDNKVTRIIPSTLRSQRIGMDSTSFNLTHLTSLNRRYRLSLYSMMNHSSNFHAQRDVRGIHTIYSQPVTMDILLRQPIEGPQIISIQQVIGTMNQVKLRTKMPTSVNAPDINLVEHFTANYLCSSPSTSSESSRWSGIANNPSSYTIVSGNSSLIDFISSGLPNVTTGDRMSVTLVTQSFSLAGYSTPSQVKGTLRDVTMVGLPLPPLLTNITQVNELNTTVKGSPFYIQMRLPKLHTADVVHINLHRNGEMLIQSSLSASRVESLPPLSRLLSWTTPEKVNLIRPLDELTLTLATSNIAGLSPFSHSYRVLVHNSNISNSRFPPNCCGYGFNSPSSNQLPIFTLPSAVFIISNTVLNTNGNKLINLSTGRNGHTDWSQDCSTERIEYFDETIRQWDHDIRVTGGWFGWNQYTLKLSETMVLKQNGELRLSIDQSQLYALNQVVVGKLIRMNVKCYSKPSNRLAVETLKLCFQFTLRTPSTQVTDSDILSQVPINQPTCTTPEEADLRFNQGGSISISQPFIVIQPIGSVGNGGSMNRSFVDIDQGKETKFMYQPMNNGLSSTDLTCSNTRTTTLASVESFHLPSSTLTTNVTIIRNQSPYPLTSHTPGPAPIWLGTDIATGTGTGIDTNPPSGADTNVGAGSTATGRSQPSSSDSSSSISSSSATSTAVSGESDASGSSSSNIPMPISSTGIGSDSSSLLPSPSPSSTSTLPSPISSSPSPPKTAIACSLTLKGILSHHLRQPTVFISNFRKELATLLKVSLLRIRVLQAKSNKEVQTSNEVKSNRKSMTIAKSSSSRRSFQLMATDGTNGDDTVTVTADSTAAIDNGDSDVADVQLSIAIEPPQSHDDSSNDDSLTEPSATSAYEELQSLTSSSSSVSTTLSADSFLRQLVSVGSSLPLPLQQCQDGTQSVQCVNEDGNEDEVEWTQGAIQLPTTTSVLVNNPMQLQLQHLESSMHEEHMFMFYCMLTGLVVIGVLVIFPWRRALRMINNYLSPRNVDGKSIQSAKVAQMPIAATIHQDSSIGKMDMKSDDCDEYDNEGEDDVDDDDNKDNASFTSVTCNNINEPISRPSSMDTNHSQSLMSDGEIEDVAPGSNLMNVGSVSSIPASGSMAVTVVSTNNLDLESLGSAPDRVSPSPPPTSTRPLPRIRILPSIYDRFNHEARRITLHRVNRANTSDVSNPS